MNSSKTLNPVLLIAAVAVAVASVSASAAPVPAPSSEEMARCAAIQARDTRLSCYDALAHRPPDPPATVARTAPAAAPATPAAPAISPPASPVQAPTTVAAVAADPANFGLSAIQTHTADLGPKSQASHISILSSNQSGRTFVVLDSGQTWTILDPDGWLNTGDAVTIKRGQFGSYLMRGPSNHTYHVHRDK
jgi:hypothetical protein